MKIDFHVHTSEYSTCASSTAEEQIESAIKQGVDVMFITEHLRLFPQDKIDELNKKYAPFKIYQGIEVTIMGEDGEDFVVLGVHDQSIEGDEWSYEELWEYVHSQNGALILVHPYRFSDQVNVDIWKYPPDAVEILSANLGEKNLERRKRLASVVSKPQVSNSDSHDKSTSGCYYNVFPGNSVSEEEIIESLKGGIFFPQELK